MKDILQGIWAIFVCLVFVAIVVLKCESDRIKEQRLRDDPLSKTRILVPKPEPKKDTGGAFDPFVPSGTDAETLKRWKAEQEFNRLLADLNKARATRPDTSGRIKKLLPLVTVEVAPMPREKAASVP